MIVSRKAYDQLQKEKDELQHRVFQLQYEIKELKDDSGEAVIRRLTNLAKVANINVHSDEYQQIMSRVFMDIGGRESSVLKGYSTTSFVKDNDQEILDRAKQLAQQASVITKQIESKKKK